MVYKHRTNSKSQGKMYIKLEKMNKRTELTISSWKKAEGRQTSMRFTERWHHHSCPLLSFLLTAEVESDTVMWWCCQTQFMALWGLDFIANSLEIKLSNWLSENKQREPQKYDGDFFYFNKTQWFDYWNAIVQEISLSHKQINDLAYLKLIMYWFKMRQFHSSPISLFWLYHNLLHSLGTCCLAKITLMRMKVLRFQNDINSLWDLKDPGY